MEYIVRQYEVWTHEYRVEADTAEAALFMVQDGVDEPEVHELSFEYSHVMDDRDEVIDPDTGLRIEWA